MSGRGRGKRVTKVVEPQNEVIQEQVAIKKVSKKKQFPIVAVITPDGIEGNLLGRTRQPLIVHLPIQSKDVPMNDMPIMYDECTVENIPIQKWTHVVVSVFNNNIEVYIDGRLRKSCSLRGFPKPNLYNMHVTPNGGFNGFLAQLDYSNAALPVDEIYKIYRTYIIN